MSNQPRRMKFIQEVQDFLMKNLMKQGFREDQVAHALKLWQSNKEAETQADAVMFHVFRDVQADIEAKEKS